MKSKEFRHYQEFVDFFVDIIDGQFAIESFRIPNGPRKFSSYTALAECYHDEDQTLKHAKWLLSVDDYYVLLEWCGLQEELRINDSNIDKYAPVAFIEDVKNTIKKIEPEHCVLSGQIGDAYKLYAVLLFGGVMSVEITQEKTEEKLNEKAC